MAVKLGKTAAFDGYWRAMRHVVRNEGLLALWSGSRITLIGIVPYSGLSFGVFETLKAKIKDSKGGKALKTHEHLAAGAFSGLFAQSVTYPLDIVRRRMQVDRAWTGSEWQMLKGIVQKEGVKGIYKGLSMNWIKGPIAVSTSFLVNDRMREMMVLQRP